MVFLRSWSFSSQTVDSLTLLLQEENMESLTKAALGAVTGALGGDSGKGPSTITLEGGAAKAAALMEQAKHQLSVERITNSRQLQVWECNFMF